MSKRERPYPTPTVVLSDGHVTGGDQVPPGSFCGGDAVKAGTFHGGDSIPAGTFHCCAQ